MVMSEYPGAHLYTNAVNVGYGAAANQAVAQSASEYVLLLNSDTRLTTGSLRALADYLDQHPQTAIAGPRLANFDGSLQSSCFHFPTPLHTFVRASSLAGLIARVPFVRDRYLPTSSHQRARPVAWILGAAMMIRREAFDAVHGFNESFFMYSEEVDLCYRLHTAGWQIHFAPVATILHIGEASTSQHRIEMGVRLYRSMRLFYRLHYSRVSMLQLRLIIVYIALRSLISDSIQLGRAGHPSDRAWLADDVGMWKRVLADTLSTTTS